MLNVIRNFNKYLKNCLSESLCALRCSVNANLLWQGAAVLLRHAFPHRLLDRLDLLAQRDARRSGWFDHFSVNRLLFFILLLQRGGRRRREGKQEKKTVEKKRWFIVMGEFIWFYKLPGLTLASEPVLTTWSERLDRSKPPKLHVLCGGSQNTINWVPFKRSHDTDSPSTPSEGQLTVIHAQHNTGNDFINVHGYMVCIYGHDVIWDCGQPTDMM